MCELLILLVWCHIFANASQVRDVAPDAIVRALNSAGFAAGGQGPGRVGPAVVRSVIPQSSTWDEINVRAQRVRAALARDAATLAFVTYYCERGPFLRLQRPSADFLRNLFKQNDKPAGSVFFLPANDVGDVLRASMVLAGGCEFIAPTSRTSSSGDLVTMTFECVYEAKPPPGAGAGAGGAAGTAAGYVGLAARAARSTSTRTGGPLALGCEGAIKLLVSIAPGSEALAIVKVTFCSANRDTYDQANSHFTLHPLVRAAVIQNGTSKATGRAIDSSSLSSFQAYAAAVLEVEVANSERIIAGNEPNVCYPSYPLGSPLCTISYADVATLRATGKYSPVDVSHVPVATLPRTVPSATKTMCFCAMKLSDWRGEEDEPTIACADERCAITLFHRECVDVGDDVLGARGGGEDSDDEGDDDVIRTRWRCATCADADPIQCYCDGKGASPDAESIECTSGASEDCAGWHHLVCVGIESEDAPEDWTCKRCPEVPK